MRKEFISAFKITNMIIFEVSYYTLGNNKHPYYSTCALQFSRNKRGYVQCGQCQNELLPEGLAKDFFRKWDEKHLLDLSNDEYSELMADMEEMKLNYEHIYEEQDTFRNKCSNISRYQLKELSMRK